MKILRFLICPLLIGLASVPALSQQQKVGSLERSRMLAILDAVVHTVEKNFYDPKLRGTDWKGLVAQAHHTIETADTNGQMLTAIFSLLYNLQDSHTMFVPPGLVNKPIFGFEAKPFGDAIRIYELKKDSPAAAAGLQLGDRILGVNRFNAERGSFDLMMLYYRALQPVAEMQIVYVRGSEPPKTVNVKAKIKTGHAVVDLLAAGGGELWDLIREAESKEKEEKKNEYQHYPDGVGYIRLPAFYGTEDGTMRDLAGKVRDDRAFIVDLRDNHGGSIDALKLFSGFFENEPRVIAQMAKRDKDEPIEVKPQKPALLGPMVILIDSESMSAAEIFARHFQRTGRARIVGDRSAGRVSAARYFPQEEGIDRTIFYGVTVAVGRVVFEGGEELEKKGVTPDDFCVPSEQDLREKRDPCLEEALGLARQKLRTQNASPPKNQ
jgi:carboxyl-terminal processing protease